MSELKLDIPSRVGMWADGQLGAVPEDIGDAQDYQTEDVSYHRDLLTSACGATHVDVG